MKNRGTLSFRIKTFCSMAPARWKANFTERSKRKKKQVYTGQWKKKNRLPGTETKKPENQEAQNQIHKDWGCAYRVCWALQILT